MKRYSALPYDKMDGVMWGLNFEIPAPCMISFASEVDMSSAERLRNSMASRPSYTALVAKAVAAALKEFPYANRRVFTRLIGSRAIQFENVNITVAVERDDSVMYANPETIYNTDRLTLAEIGGKLREMHDPARQEDQRWTFFKKLVKILPGFLARAVAAMPRFFPSLWVKHRGGAVLITSPAKYGVDAIDGFWHWPVTFSFGLVKERPVAVNGEIVARPTTFLGMSFDRRIMVGAPAAKFFNRVCRILENAEAELGEKKQAAPVVNRISERLCPKRLGIEATMVEGAIEVKRR